jgi:very-short-patch-repair endonuclease
MAQPRNRTHRARKLRRDATEAETLLWNLLRRKMLNGYKFRRQHPIGPYVADLACPGARLIVEIDGGQHAEERRAADERRTRDLMARGWLARRAGEPRGRGAGDRTRGGLNALPKPHRAKARSAQLCWGERLGRGGEDAVSGCV